MTKPKSMRSLLRAALWSLFVIASVAEAAEAKYQVCSITINSNDEIEAFKNFLPASEFEFHELSPNERSQTTVSPVDGRRVRTHYLQNYCVRKQRCDVLVISGHFGGTFTGTANFTLSLQDMNSLSCSSECDGIFGVKEVFLFGCNTLAGKTKDSRTPREYVQVLREHGYPEAEARQIANLRYGPTGGTFLESMQRVFNRTPKIYGFDSISPRGSTDAQMLKNYFKVIGDYKKHLDELQMGSPKNTALKQAFRYTSFLEASGRDSEERGLMCEILDPAVPALKKATLFEKAISGASPLSFIPSIQKAIRENRELNEQVSKGRMNPKVADVFERIRNNSSVKDLVGRAFESLQEMLPTNAFDLLDFSQQIGWFSNQEVTLKKSRFYRERLSEAKPEDLTTLCELRAYSVALEPEDLQYIVNKPLELKKVSCLPSVTEAGFFKAMSKALFLQISAKKNEHINVYQSWVFQTLMQNGTLGKSFVELYIEQSDEVFFHPLIIQKGLETNAFFYDTKGVLSSLEKRIARNPTLTKFRALFASLKE